MSLAGFRTIGVGRLELIIKIYADACAGTIANIIYDYFAPEFSKPVVWLADYAIFSTSTTASIFRMECWCIGRYFLAHQPRREGG